MTRAIKVVCSESDWQKIVNQISETYDSVELEDSNGRKMKLKRSWLVTYTRALNGK